MASQFNAQAAESQIRNTEKVINYFKIHFSSFFYESVHSDFANVFFLDIYRFRRQHEQLISVLTKIMKSAKKTTENTKQSNATTAQSNDLANSLALDVK